MLNCEQFSDLAYVLHQLCLIKGYVADRERLGDELVFESVLECVAEALSKFSPLDIDREDVYDSFGAPEDPYTLAELL